MTLVKKWDRELQKNEEREVEEIAWLSRHLLLLVHFYPMNGEHRQLVKYERVEFEIWRIWKGKPTASYRLAEWAWETTGW